jgi:hypothetical protein
MYKLSRLIIDLNVANWAGGVAARDRAIKAIDDWEQSLQNIPLVITGKPKRNKLQEAIKYAQMQSSTQCGRMDGYGNAKREAYCDIITKLESLDKENE